MKLRTMLILAIVIVVIVGFVFGDTLLKRFMPDWKMIVANFMCFIGAQMALPFITLDLTMILFFSISGTAILMLLIWSKNLPMIKIVAIACVFIGITLILLFFFSGMLIPWFGGDDIAFGIVCTSAISWLFLRHMQNKKQLIGIVLILFIVFWGIYKMAGYSIAMYAERMIQEEALKSTPEEQENIQNVKCLQETPFSLPRYNDQTGSFDWARIPYDLFSPVFLIGAVLAVAGFIGFILSLVKVKK